MNTQKIAYWFALALFAFALHSEYRHGAFPALHRTFGQAGSEMCRLAAHANQLLATAKLITGDSSVRPDDLIASADARELAEARAELLRERTQQRVELLRDRARFQADMIRTHVHLERAQVDRLRAQMNSQFRFKDAANRRMVIVTSSKCPKQGARITVASSDDSVDDADDQF
jgi:hypothetical protein